MCVTRDECEEEMRWCAAGALFLALVLGIEGCGPGRGAGRTRVPRKLTALVFKQHVPNESENNLSASGQTEGRIGRNDSRFRDLVPIYNRDIIFKDEEGTGADRLMTQKCKEKLNTLAIQVMNQWPGVKLRVTEGWDEEGHHSADSLHYEGRAVDITTSDRDRGKYGMLARLAVEAGFDWVYYESRSHIHCSVKSESKAGKYGGCFSAESSVVTSGGERRKLSELRVGEKILAVDPVTQELVFSEVILFLDWNPSERRQFFEFNLASGRTLTVTPSHLIPNVVNNVTRTVYAAKLSVGSRLLVSDLNNNKLIEDTVVQVKPVLKTGVFAPLTIAGTVVVDGVVASCYATIDSQSIAHWAFAPVRLLINVKESASRLWNFISKPISGWSSPSTISTRSPTPGIYWYAEVLYIVGDYLIPSHIYK